MLCIPLEEPLDRRCYIAATYPTGVKAPVDFKKTMAIVFDDLLPKWNYRALPQRLES
jgi:hypothetical protein